MTGSALLLLALGAVLASAAMTGLWFLQVRARDASHVDVGGAVPADRQLARWRSDAAFRVTGIPRDRGAGAPQPRGRRRAPANDEHVRAASPARTGRIGVTPSVPIRRVTR